MAKYEITPAAIRTIGAAQEQMQKTLQKAAAQLRDVARALDYDGSPFGGIPDELGAAFRRLNRQACAMQTMRSVLASVLDVYVHAEESLVNTPGKGGAETPSETGDGAEGHPKASIKPDQTDKTKSPGGEETSAPVPKDQEGDAGEGKTSSGEPSADLPDSATLGDSVAASMDHRPYSAAVFSSMSTADRAGWLAAVASSLYTQFPQLSVGGSSKVSFPLGKGMTAYSSVSVTGNKEGSSKVKIAQALDANTGLIKDGISISDDGSTVRFTKDGISTSVKTETGTWKIDSTSLSRTSSAKIDKNTTCSFTEKVDAKGYVSLEECVSSKAGGCSVSTTVGLKNSNSGQNTPSIVPATSTVSATVPVSAYDSSLESRQLSRIYSYVNILTSGLVGSTSGAAAVPVAVPIF